MKLYHSSVFSVAVGLCSLGMTATAQTVLNGNHSVDGALCVGASCTGSESFGEIDLKIKQFNPKLFFEDSSVGGAPTRDWQILTNEDNVDKFVIEDVEAGRDVFVIEGDAQANSVYVSDDGYVGLGTSIPLAPLHITGSANPTIRFVGNDANEAWDLKTNDNFFWVQKQRGDIEEFVFVIENGARNDSIRIDENSNVGLGNNAPEGKLHTRGTGVQLAYFESSDGGPVQVRFRTDSENRRFLAVNNANQVQSQIVFLDDEIKFTGTTDSGADLWLSVGPNGITSQGPTCGSPCDLTFDPNHFTVPPIAERAAYMWDKMHLPAIGPTNPDTPINLTEKTGGIIHELEVAHIYIEQLHSKTEQQDEIIAQLIARLEDLEAKQ